MFEFVNLEDKRKFLYMKGADGRIDRHSYYFNGADLTGSISGQSLLTNF